MKRCIQLLNLFFLACLFLMSCQLAEQSYVPDGLTKLSREDMLERATNRKTINRDAVVKTEKGEVLSRESMGQMRLDDYYADQYVDDSGEVMEIVLRLASSEDKEFMKKLQATFEAGPPVKAVNIDCANQSSILAEVFEKDQAMRKSGEMKPEIDQANQVAVVSLIEKCGFPSADQVGKEGIYTVFLVIQHASKFLRKKYFPMIQSAVDRGDLDIGSVALMEDRMLLENNQKQKYGS